MKFTDMAYSSAEAKEESIEAEESERPAYPWGLCLYLNEEVLTKLGMKREDFEVGEEIALMAMAKVTGINEREYEGSAPSCCIDLQITEMDLGNEKDEEPKPKTSLGERMYG